MRLSDYRSSALRFEGSEIRSQVDIRLQHGIIGLASELGELLEVSFAEDFTIEKFVDEAGDQLWYMNLIADAIGDDIGTYIPTEATTNVIEEVLAQYALHVSRLSDILKKALFYRDRQVQEEKVRYHLIQALSCLNILLRTMNTTLPEVAASNIEKLEMRHGLT